jgi:hypothetical protein
MDVRAHHLRHSQGTPNDSDCPAALAHTRTQPHSGGLPRPFSLDLAVEPRSHRSGGLSSGTPGTPRNPEAHWQPLLLRLTSSSHCFTSHLHILVLAALNNSGSGAVARSLGERACKGGSPAARRDCSSWACLLAALSDKFISPSSAGTVDSVDAGWLTRLHWHTQCQRASAGLSDIPVETHEPIGTRQRQGIRTSSHPPTSELPPELEALPGPPAEACTFSGARSVGTTA